MVGIDVAIDLDAVFEVAPLVDLVVAVGIEESPQDFAAMLKDDIARWTPVVKALKLNAS